MRFISLTRLRHPGRCALGLLLSLALCGTAQTAEKAAVYVPSETSSPLERVGDEKPWQFLRESAVSAGTSVLGGLGPIFDSPNGAVRLRLMGDINGISPFPILETVVTFKEPKDADLAFVMERGRVDLVNKKEKGPATIHVTVRGKTGTITLLEPDSRLTIEIYSRWPKGVPFKKTPKPTDVPVLALLLVATKGEAELKGTQHTISLKAPPGPALLLIDDLADLHPQVETLDKLPKWAVDLDDAATKSLKANIKLFREKAEKSSIGEALDGLVASDDATLRRVGLVLMGGLDDLPRLAVAVANSKHEDVLENAILVLRNWISREPGQDLKLYTGLIEKAKYSKVEAEAALQLLHSFGDGDLEKPETYQALIQFLESDRLLLRGLAHWHLVRLVQDGRKIGFQPAAAKDDRQKAAKAWQELVPEGTLPGQAKAKP